tara:strand:- start:99 stop:1304 length:1206 start_codon:yes stop_codon:yes gene_type:complete
MVYPMKNTMGFQVMNTTEEEVHYAQKRNKIFENTIDKTICSINDRIEYVYGLSESNQRLRVGTEDSLLEFEMRYQKMQEAEFFYSALAKRRITESMANIVIDMRLQRVPTMEAIQKYIRNYRWYKVQPIKVFVWKDPNDKEHLVCWDGQHTLIMLYLIATQVHKLNPSEVQIPVNITDGITIEEARESLMSENGEGRVLFDAVDMHEQGVFARRDTGSTVKSHSLAEQKQQDLEDNFMFLANPRRGEMDKPGALTRTQEFLDPTYSHVVTKYFAQWFYGLNGSSRHAFGVEVATMYNFFHECVKSGMELDRRYIKQVAMVCRSVTGNDFDGNMVWDRVRKIYEVDFRSKQAGLPENERVRISHDGHKNDKMLAFICAMLKDKGVDVPDVEPYFPVTKQDLF